MIAAGALIVIDTLTSPRSIPWKSVSMSSNVSTATPSRPTSPSERVIGVVAHQRRHVKRRRKPRLAVIEQIPKAPVGLLRRPEPRELTHRPQPPPIHRRIHTTRERKLPRQPDRLARRQIGLRIQRPDRLTRERRKRNVALRALPPLRGHDVASYRSELASTYGRPPRA